METVVLTASQKYTAWMYTPTKTRSESCLNTSTLGWPSHRRITSKPSKCHSSLVKPPVSLPTSPMNHVCEMKCIQTGSYTYKWGDLLGPSSVDERPTSEFLSRDHQELGHNGCGIYTFLVSSTAAYAWLHLSMTQGYKGVHIEEKSIDETYIDVTLGTWIQMFIGPQFNYLVCVYGLGLGSG